MKSGEMQPAEIIALFQDLVNSGIVWQLQGSYGRMAHEMLQSGIIHPRANA